MTLLAKDVLARRSDPPGLIIFDCDGVLVDSEHIAGRLLAEDISALGWVITPEECHRLFLGCSLTDMLPMIAARVAIPPGWTLRVAERMVRALAEEAEAMPGAEAALRAVSALGLPWRVASNSSHKEMAVKFARTGLADLVAGRLHSAADVVRKGGRGKPAPDLFLATAAAASVPPSACVVVEDSLPGARAARAAGMSCLALVPHGEGQALQAEGAGIFRALAELPAMLAGALRVAA